jgi:protein-L-isoaspartate(D-aspartate) O-methyltransferase
VPREAFVPEADRARAYLNVALPIGHGQTISQPYVVALMLELLDLTGRERVLEIGAGSGYLTALLARLAREVYAVELQPELADTAGTRLGELGVENVALRCADGRAGWPEAAPFGAIIVNAAAPEVPAALMEQLKPGGRLIMPLGEPWATQELTLIEHPRRGEPRRRGVLPVAFVPLLSEGGPA